MTRDEMQELKRLAESATPGPWKVVGHWRVADGDGLEDVARVSSPDNGTAADDAVFIAAANPAVVLSLIARIEELEAERDAAKQKAEESHRAGMLFGLGGTL